MQIRISRNVRFSSLLRHATEIAERPFGNKNKEISYLGSLESIPLVVSSHCANPNILKIIKKKIKIVKEED